MPDEREVVFREVVPKTGLLYNENITEMIFCKPKIMPLKSFTLEKLDKIQKDAESKLKSQKTELKDES